MRLYYAKGACSLADRILINELGLTAQYESVDLKAKKTETGADFLQINPKGAVPALVTDQGDILTENAVVLQYLAETNHATQLLPDKSDFMHYRVLEWVNFIASDLHKGFGPLFNPNIPDNFKQDIIIPLLKNKFKFVNSQLNQKKYLFGEEFTIADCYLFVMTFWLSKFKIDIAEWSNLSRYYDNLLRRKAVEKSLKEEGILK